MCLLEKGHFLRKFIQLLIFVCDSDTESFSPDATETGLIFDKVLLIQDW